MSPDARDDNADSQANEESTQPLLQVNATTFSQFASGSDYSLYQTLEQRTYGNVVVDIFLEHVPNKGWWGAMRFNGRLRIQLSLDRTTLFPTPEIALLATEEFLADKEYVRAALTDMLKEKRDLQTFQHVPPRPADIDPVQYFSPVLLELNGTIFTLYHLTHTEAVYRSWGQRQVAEMAADLRLIHVYRKGWQAGLLCAGSRIVMFEPAIDQLFLTPEKALETLLAFCSEEENVRKLAQRLRETHPQEQIMVRKR